MNQLPQSPLKTASKPEVLIGGVVSLIAGMALLVPTTWMVAQAFSSGRLTLPIIFLIGLMISLVTMFFAVAFALFRGRKQPKAQLMGSATLYVVGSFMIGLPLAMVVLSLWMGSTQDLYAILRASPLAGLGLMVIHLGRLRSKKHS